jgi:hypothetical protein
MQEDRFLRPDANTGYSTLINVPVIHVKDGKRLSADSMYSSAVDYSDEAWHSVNEAKLNGSCYLAYMLDVAFGLRQCKRKQQGTNAVDSSTL